MQESTEGKHIDQVSEASGAPARGGPARPEFEHCCKIHFWRFFWPLSYLISALVNHDFHFLSSKELQVTQISHNKLNNAKKRLDGCLVVKHSILALHKKSCQFWVHIWGSTMSMKNWRKKPGWEHGVIPTCGIIANWKSSWIARNFRINKISWIPEFFPYVIPTT